MDYLTQVSINYIEAIERHLKIKYDGNAYSINKRELSVNNIKDLKDDIQGFFSDDFKSIQHIISKDTELTYGVGYGFVQDFDKFIKIGMLSSNRVILWDYLWGRLLENEKDYIQYFQRIKEVSENLIRIKQCVINGGVVILPHPTYWKEKKKELEKHLGELHKKKELWTSTNYGLTCALSVVHEFNIYPYTLYDENPFNIKLTKRINKLVQKRKKYFNEENSNNIFNVTKLLDNNPFEVINSISVNDFYLFLKEDNSFYTKFKEVFLYSQRGLQNTEKIEMLMLKKMELIKGIKSRKKRKIQKNIIETYEWFTILSLSTYTLYRSTDSEANNLNLLWLYVQALSSSLAKILIERTTKYDKDVLVLGFEKMREINKKSLS